MRIRLAALLLSLTALALATAGPAQAITYGYPDGNRHPNVGALVGTFDGQTYPYCSGALVSPTVFLTAAHCDTGQSTVYVTFDTAYSSRSKLSRGRFHADPAYNRSRSDPHDVAVVVFPRPIRGITPALLPTAGLLDELRAARTLTQRTRFTAVGYGGQEPVNQPGGPVIAYLDRREYAVSSFNALNPGYLRLSQNNAHGDGGACHGDSGGPNFLGAGSRETDVVVAITITGDALCKATNVTYRLDTKSARAFLAGFVTLP